MIGQPLTLYLKGVVPLVKCPDLILQDLHLKTSHLCMAAFEKFPPVESVRAANDIFTYRLVGLSERYGFPAP